MNIVTRFKKVDRTQRLRYGTMLLGILALAPPVGFVAQAFGSSSICGNLCPRMAIGTDFLTELSRRTAGVALLLTWLASTVFFGRWMCSHGCPVGGLTEFGSKIVPRRLKLDYSRLFDAPLFRYGFLGAFILLPAVGYASICCGYCNLSAVPEAFGAIFVPRLRPMLTFGSRLVAMGLYIGLLGVLSRDGRGHCHLVCPIGALDSIMNAVGARLPFARRERIQLANCSGCGFCANHCPTWAITVDKQAPEIATIDYHRCNQCRICESKCPKQAIIYSTPLGVKEQEYDPEARPAY
jgi:formate hydrogenlyase subunit 6/NADH:ubiquinone oxidoreductase subunit I